MAVERRRIVLVNNQGLMSHGGGPTILRHIVARLSPHHDVTVASFDPPRADARNVRQLTLPLPGQGHWRFAPWHRARHYRAVLSSALEGEFDIVIAMDCHLALALPALIAERKAYIALSCAPRQEWFGRLRRRISIAAQYAYLERSLIRQCDLTVVASDSQKEEIKRFEFLPRFAPHVLRPIFDDGEALLAKNDSDLVFTTICRLEPVKRVDRVLAIADRLRDRDCRFVIVGDGSQSEILRRQAADLGLSGVVEFVGESDSPEDYLLRADILLHTSAYESFGIAIFEAMRHGVVPVLNNGEGTTIGIAEDIETGVSGLLADFGDIDGVCRDLDGLLTDSGMRSRLKCGARKRAVAMAQRDYVGDLADALGLKIA